MSAVLLLSVAILIAVCINVHQRHLHSYLKSVCTLTNRKWQQTKASLGVWDIPGPVPLPILGTKWIYLWGGYKISKMHEAMEDLNKKYGPILLEVAPGGIPIVHLFDKSDIEKVIKYPSKYPFRPPTEIVITYRRSRPDRYCSMGITHEQGESWQKLRSRLTSHITSPRILQNFLPSLNEVCDDFVRLLKARRDPATQCVDNFPDIANLLGMEAVCTLMLGRRMGFLATDNSQPERIRQLAWAVKQLFISQRDSYYGMGLWKYLPTKTYAEFARSEEIIYDVISELVEDALKDDQLNCADDDVRSIFHQILQVPDLDIRDKKSAIIDFIAAGIETLGNTLVFVLSNILSHPTAKDKIVAEFAEYKDSEILTDAISKAVFTKSCLQETYRIQPTAFCLARILEEDATLSGYDLKAGTVLLCQNMIACKKNQNFKNSQQFVPERWLDADNRFNIQAESASIVVPFGIGKRTCPGKRFVEMELVVLIAKLFLAFEISLPAPVEAEFEFLLAPKTPVRMVLKDRV